jgi:hypothetical protein
METTFTGKTTHDHLVQQQIDNLTSQREQIDHQIAILRIQLTAIVAGTEALRAELSTNEPPNF